MLVDQLVALGTFDAVTHLAEVYPLKVFGDAVGLPEEGREKLLPYANMVFNSFGPRNQLLAEAQASARPVQQWITDSCQREALRPGSLGAQIWIHADTGKLPEEWAALLVHSLLSAGLDTTINGLAAAVYAFAMHPEQWLLLRKDLSLAAPAFEETIRWESPVQTFFRTTTHKVEVAGKRIPPGEKILLFLGAANRDPRRWNEPDHFDIRRNTSGHVGFGMGIHRCIGQTVARVEAGIVLRELARRVKYLELNGQPQRKPNNTLQSWKSLPAKVTSASG